LAGEGSVQVQERVAVFGELSALALKWAWGGIFRTSSRAAALLLDEGTGAL